MRILKLALLSFIFIFFLLTAMSLLIPPQVRISRAINVQSTPASVLSFVENQDRWPEWHPVYNDSVASEQWGRIEKNIVLETDTSFVIQLQQAGRKPVTSAWLIHQYSHTDSITLQWYMDFKLAWYPWEKFSSMFYEKTYGVMMEQGLSNLKEKVAR